ncbi:MAG TPA: 23S rRNA (adenine(2503)-C(2))-methyltransferase RlmN, partial [Nitrospiria bacterium]|nr:23S rRNA (adenine(2503)-C(2))-methyltransferase RlmN [Nitrospiria bacterium]
MATVDLKALSFSELEAFTQELGWPKYRAAQIWRWIYQKKMDDFSQMTNLSKTDRDLLEERAFIGHLKVAEQNRSLDGTMKYLMELADGSLIEAVLIPGAPSGNRNSRRLTLCISTQVGCTLDCVFCYTGTMGLKRNLRAHEIVDQVIVAQKSLAESQRLTNIVLMGMGEPLANYREVIEALYRITSPNGLAIPPRRITLSTAGLIPQIKQFMETALKVNLAVSLNAPNQALRDRLMPKVNQAYPLEELIAACRSVPLAPRKRITFEYVLLGGVNDSPEHAKQLARLVRGLACKINLIPFNE